MRRPSKDSEELNLVADSKLANLKHFKRDVNELGSGNECGLRLADVDAYKVGDIIQCYTIKKHPRKLLSGEGQQYQQSSSNKA